MSEGGYKIRNQNAIHFITFSVYNISVESCESSIPHLKKVLETPFSPNPLYRNAQTRTS